MMQFFAMAIYLSIMYALGCATSRFVLFCFISLCGIFSYMFIMFYQKRFGKGTLMKEYKNGVNVQDKEYKNGVNVQDKEYKNGANVPDTEYKNGTVVHDKEYQDKRK